MLQMNQKEIYSWAGEAFPEIVGIYEFHDTKTAERGYVKIHVPNNWCSNAELFIQVAAHHAYALGNRIGTDFSDAQYLIDKPWKFGDAVLEYLVEVDGFGGDGLKWLFDVCQMYGLPIERCDYEETEDE